MIFDSSFGVRQAGWSTLPLKSLCAAGGGEMKFGIRVAREHIGETGSGVPIVMPDVMGDGTLKPENARRVRPECVETYAGFMLRSGDVVCCQRGDLERRVHIGSEQAGVILGRDCMLVRLPGGPVNPLYLYYYLSHANVRQWVAKNAVGGANPRMSIRTFENLPVAYPPLEQQAGIASLLAALDRKIALDCALNETLNSGARTMLLSTLGGVSPEEIAGRMSARPDVDGLPVRTVGEICLRMENGRTPATQEPSFWSSPGTPWISSADVRQGIILNARQHVSREGMLRCYMKLWPRGTTIVAMFGETAGKVALLGMPACGNQACCALVAPAELQHYLYVYLLNASAALSRLAVGSTYQSLSQQIIANFPIVVPPPEKLAQFDHFVKPWIDRIEHNLRQIELLRSMRDNLLCKLIPLKAGRPELVVAALRAKHSIPDPKIVQPAECP